ncbi:hypothetical protein ACFOPN_06915 [Xanthomonas hyacinthi]|uniref:hypothetical protein n=1 Tax=Xanthomonas hyacinthi TaxID=56455 RepID=UPI0036184844
MNMKRFLVGFAVTLASVVVVGWLFNQSIYQGWGATNQPPGWVQAIGVFLWLLFGSGMAYVLLPVLGGALWVWLGKSKGGRFSGVVSSVGAPDGGRGCEIAGRVSIGGEHVGTVVVPDALLDFWRHPGVSPGTPRQLELLKVGRCAVALRCERGTRNAWGLGAIHKAFPFMSMGFFAVTVVSLGFGALFTYFPVYLWGASRVNRFLLPEQTPLNATTGAGRA